MGTVLLVRHVVAAVFLIGPMALVPRIALRAVRAGNGPAVNLLARWAAVFSWASLVVAVFGFGVFGIWEIPPDDALAARADGAPRHGPGRQRRAGRPGPAASGQRAAGSGIVSLLLLAVAVLVVWQP
ncbi:hypothetical protein [Geodermatophilus sp. DF01-2]|uniref:hypothetical protein n=1 Tax=Geodermatophilus sp. DF01-2 TaxID=2559610 RepID=UPI001ADD6E28|nr:hypothetical protein [Geodermatophilus sp. DF01_2]